ncbi:MAG: hypothetical protein MPN21_04630 [Thermoanaerobaculia bacterium]|nr:hypothetical protein [Thermoanaerobaculia bacterium]
MRRTKSPSDFFFLAILSLGLAAVVPMSLSAQAVPQGAEFPVNNETTGNQDWPRVSADGDGNFVVVWQSASDDVDTAGTSVHGRRYDSSGTALGTQFLVNTYTTYSQSFPDVESTTDGRFVVVFQGGYNPGDYNEIFARRFDTTGTAVGNEMQVNTIATADQSRSVVAMDSSGGFAVAWTRDCCPPGGDASAKSVAFQRFSSAGVAIGGELQTNTFTTGSQQFPDLVIEPDGDFQVVWTSDGPTPGDSSFSSSHRRLFDSSGSAVGAEIQINTYTTGSQAGPEIARDAQGNFVVVWIGSSSPGNDNSIFSIQARRYASDGTALTDDFQVNTITTNNQNNPAVDMAADGTFVVVWHSNAVDTTTGITGRLFDSSGSAVGTEFEINTYTTGQQAFPDVAIAEDGSSFVVVWESATVDGSGDGIRARRFVPDSDQDGVGDGDDLCPGFDDTADNDADGTPDDCDICAGSDDSVDSDSDGVPDGCDVCAGFDDSVDSDSDGVPDGCDMCAGSDDSVDSDSDGVPDGCDICAGSDDSVDSDSDGVPDGCDVCAGFDDSVDSDSDGVPDGCDVCAGFDDSVDSDVDTIPDGCDVCPGFSDLLDSDFDGVPDGCDICAGSDDAIDSDSDGVPDGCDQCPGSDDSLDDDGDGVPDGCDVCQGDDATGDDDGDGLCADTDCDDTDPTNACAVIFTDGFESGNTTQWSSTVQ